MKRDELLTILRKIMNHECSEREEIGLLSLLGNSTPHPAISDLIYWPPDNKELTPEEIADIALSYDRRENMKLTYNSQADELIKNVTPSENFSCFEDKLADYFNKTDKLIKVYLNKILPKNSDIIAEIDMGHIALDEAPEIIAKLEKQTKNFIKSTEINLSAFGDTSVQLAAAEYIENHLLDAYPDVNIWSYTVFGKKTVFSFMLSCENDRITDMKLMRQECPVRKNVF
ncbi:MAG: bacteriocin immunity protein [Oscillospiraceae bacterium]|nr:bacteriocin immunity protein [Oscillospiraceae bacterium]